MTTNRAASMNYYRADSILTMLDVGDEQIHDIQTPVAQDLIH